MSNYEQLTIRSLDHTQHGKEIAAEPAVSAVVSAIMQDEDFYPTVYPATFSDRADMDIINNTIVQMGKSEIFKTTFQATERARIIHIVNNKDTFWTIPSPQEPITTMPRYTSDIPLLCGASLFDLEQIGQIAFLEQYATYGFEDKLAFANFLGSLVISRHKEEHQDPLLLNRDTALLLTKDAVSETYLNIEGTVHGDFRMRKSVTYICGSTDPAGATHQFAPRPEIEFFADYHSSDSTYIEMALVHLSRVFSPQQQRTIIEETAVSLAELTKHEEAGTANFGDYASRDDNQLTVSRFKDYLSDTNIQPLLTHYEVATMPNLSVRIISNPNALHIENVQIKNNNEVGDTLTCITVPNDKIADFMQAIIMNTYRGRSRTGGQHLYNILKTRYDMLSQ